MTPKLKTFAVWLVIPYLAAAAIISASLLYRDHELPIARLRLFLLVSDQLPLLQKSADAADSAARIANRNADDSERFFRLQNRPFITVSKLEQTTPLESGDSRISLSTHNSGRTPALKLRIFSGVFIGNKAIKLNSAHRSEAVIASDKETTNTYTLSLNETDAKVVMSGSELVFKGTIQYTDIFKEWHSTTFCARYFPKEKNYKYCENRNDVE